MIVILPQPASAFLLIMRKCRTSGPSLHWKIYQACGPYNFDVYNDDNHKSFNSKHFLVI